MATIQCKLCCTQALQEKKVITLSADPAKKSVFWLGNDPSLVDTEGDEKAEQQELFLTASPAEASFDSTSPWAIGGFQLVSNAQQVKVYLTPPNKEEAYLTTVKGLPYAKTNDANGKMFKSMCVIPGGVRPVSRVRLVFEKLDQNAKDSDEVCNIQWVKLTARIVTSESSSTPKSAQQQREDANPLQRQQMMQSLFGGPPTSQTSQSSSQKEMMMMQAMMMGASSKQTLQFPPHQTSIQSAMQMMSLNGEKPASTMNSTAVSSTPNEPLATASDLSASMAGLNFSLRSSEDRILKKVKASQDSLQSQLMQQQQQYISSLQQIIIQQNAWIHQQLVDQEARMKEFVAASLKVPVDEASPSSLKNKKESHYLKSNSFESKAPSTEPLWQQYASLDTPK